MQEHNKNKESSDSLSALIDLISDPVVVLDSLGKIVCANRIIGNNTCYSLFTTKAQSMGFGLAICKRIIEAHNGTIAIKTVKDKGTTFTVTLPIDPKFEVGVKTHGQK